MYLKTLRVQLKDLFVEIKEEKQKLLKEIELLKDFRICLNSFVNCCKCDQNLINGNKFIANQLENQYLTSFQTNLVIHKPNVDQICDKLTEDKQEIKISDICSGNDVFVEDEVIINENTLDIDCRQLSDECLINENIVDIDCRQIANSLDLQLEVIPKKEVKEEIIDLEPEEINQTVEPKSKDIELLINGEKSVSNTEEPKEVSIGTDPRMSENRFSYLTSFVNQTKSSEDMNSIANFSANNVNNSSKTIVVEKNKKIIGFVCNIENCTEFYKSIIGLQSHIDRIHNRSQTVANKPLPNRIKLNSFKTLAKKSNKSPKISPKKSRNSQKSVNEWNADPNKRQSEDLSRLGYEDDIQKKAKVSGKYLKCQCKRCGKSFKSEFALKTHIRFTKHEISSKVAEIEVKKNTQKYKFKCNLEDCGKSFKSRFALKQHLKRTDHKSVLLFNRSKNTFFSVSDQICSSFKCSNTDCKAVFKHRFALNQHMKTCKTGGNLSSDVKQFSCEITGCKNRFNSYLAMKYHIKKFHRLPPLKCKLKNCHFRCNTFSEKSTHFKEFHSS